MKNYLDKIQEINKKIENKIVFMIIGLINNTNKNIPRQKLL